MIVVIAVFMTKKTKISYEKIIIYYLCSCYYTYSGIM